MGATRGSNKQYGDDAVTFEEALQSAGSGVFQICVNIVGGLILFCSYVSVGSIAFVLPSAQCDLNMDSEKKGQLASVGFIGLIVSCHFWGFLSDTLGRRYILIRCLIVDGILYFITSFIPYYPVILVLRLINGIVSSGGVACIYAYIGEFQVDKNRTRALMAASVVASFAYFITPIYGWATLTGTWKLDLFPGLTYKPWRLYYAGCGVPSLICALLIFFLPESPKFLLAKGRSDAALNVLRTINKVNKRNSEEFTITNIKINNSEMVATLGEGKSKILAFLQLMWDQTAPLFKSPHRINIALVCLSQYLVYFSNGGMYLWLPETMNRLALYKQETDNDAAKFCDVVEYAVQQSPVTMNISQELTNRAVRSIISEVSANNSPECSEEIDLTVYKYLFILGVIQCINLSVITTISRICNKKFLLCLLTTGGLLSSIAILKLEITQFVAYDACLLIIFTGSVIPTINTVCVDLFPTNLRGMAGCLTLMSCRLGTVSTNIIAGFLIDSHCNEFIWTFVVSMTICLITVSLLPMKAKSEDNVKTII